MKHADGHILALDIATTTGWCRGAPGAVPTCGSICFGDEDTSANAIFAKALTWCSRFFADEPRVNSIILEAMLPPTAMHGQTNRATRDRLAGLHGIVRAVAHLRGVYEIS